jgi:hypothetical protein
MVMKRRKKYNLYKIDLNGKKFSIFDVLFYLKLIAIVIFAVIDTVIDIFFLLVETTRTFFRGDWFDTAIKKYLVYSRKMKNFTSIKNRSMVYLNSELKKFQTELFMNKERRAFFNSLKKRKQNQTKKHAPC